MTSAKKQELLWYKIALSSINKRKSFDGDNGVCEILSQHQNFEWGEARRTLISRELLPLLNSKRTCSGAYFFNNDWERSKALEECIRELEAKDSSELGIEVHLVIVLLFLCAVAAYAFWIA